VQAAGDRKKNTRPYNSKLSGFFTTKKTGDWISDRVAGRLVTTGKLLLVNGCDVKWGEGGSKDRRSGAKTAKVEPNEKRKGKRGTDEKSQTTQRNGVDTDVI